jgi:hypothetical protein
MRFVFDIRSSISFGVWSGQPTYTRELEPVYGYLKPFFERYEL